MGEGGMKSKLRLAASLLAATAVVLMAATAIVAANPHTMYTCTKTKKNGTTEVKTVPEPAVDGQTQAGWTCVPEAEQGGQQGGQPGDQGGQSADDQDDQGGQQDDQQADD